MALSIKDEEAERLAVEVARLTGESKTRAVKVALRERRDRLELSRPQRDRGGELRRFLEQEVWSQVPHRMLGRPLSRGEREEILGYGPEGV
ncbi:MAG TPA: type II toxin-antitoxin system VapB family antitoxin [Solirubrobacteraceae bacterium]|jgi:antitoxin VapB|nr:type II toxin-antitoxin system VapB family antitoxin [Solirubrobacteraceae bacterium]